MPLQATSGAASYDAFGGGVPVVPAYIEEVFSTYLYTGTGASQTITNNIDLSTKGGLVWIKDRTVAENHNLFDTARGAGYQLITNETGAQGVYDAQRLSAFTTSGFSIGTRAAVNLNNSKFASWTFRKQPKFFDVVTFTSSSAGDTTFSHNLGVAAGCIILKNTQSADGWVVYHRSVGNNAFLRLNTTAAQDPLTGSFSVTSTSVTVNASLMIDNNTYVAYLFAHNAGGFGLTGTDNVISCGSYTGNGSATGPVITLGYEPQWVMIKKTSDIGNWHMHDIMRDMSVTSNSLLWANLSDAEVAGASAKIAPLATGFQITNSTNGENESGGTFIYIAIRRGPMKVPTSGTSVFAPVASRSSGTSQSTPIFNAGFPVDTLITGLKAGGGDYWIPRLTVGQMTSSSTAAESSVSATYNFGGMLGILSATGDLSNSTVCGWNFKRAPSFFDVVCYTGTGSLRTVSHNLGAVPELLIVKRRDTAEDWNVYSATTGNAAYLRLNTTAAVGTAGADALWGSTTPTSSVFTVKTSGGTNASGGTFVAYLFATCAGVSKVGSYTGTGTTKQVDCGFAAGARFVLIKRTDSTGDWYVWDTARGIVAGNDPYLLLNSTDAETTTTDYIDTYSAGFEISSTAPAAINASGGTFIFLAIA